MWTVLLAAPFAWVVLFGVPPEGVDAWHEVSASPPPSAEALLWTSAVTLWITTLLLFLAVLRRLGD